MSATLWLLIWLRFRGWWRRLRRNVATLRGAIFVAFGVVLTGCWLTSLLFAPMTPDAANLEHVRRFAPLVMLGYCLLTILTSAGDRSLTFSPAEINLLFSGPFTRRQLLGYKIMTATLSTFFASLLFTVLLRGFAPFLGAAFVAILLAMLFLQFFGIAVALISETIGEYAHNARRKLAFLVVGTLAVGVLLSVGREAFGLQPRELLEKAEASPVLQVVLTPFRWFGDTFVAEQLWPDLVQNAALCLLVDLCLLAVVFLLDARYLEAASAASERVYARLERMRAGPAAALSTASGSAHFSLGDAPWLGGAGPIAWRQALTAFRNLKGLFFIVVTFASLLVVPLLFKKEETPADTFLPQLLLGTIFGMSIFLLQLLSFDFRGDIDRMEVLKSLPLSPYQIVLGQLLTPVVMACLLQYGGFLFIGAAWGGLWTFLALAPLFLVPFNVLLFEVMNLLFLWFPTRMTPTTAGDFQMMGRQMMLFFAIYVLVGVLAGTPALIGFLVYLLFGQSWVAGLVTCWTLLLGIVLGLLPLLALAFRNFDVARDTPP